MKRTFLKILILLMLVHQAPAGTPVELEVLRTKWRVARAQAVNRIDQKYLAGLQKSVVELTKKEKLQQAITFKREVDEVKKLLENPAADTQRAGKTLIILGATWGTHHKIMDVSEKLRSLIKDNKLWVNADYRKLGDPHGGHRKRLIVTYRLGAGPIIVKAFNEGHRGHLYK